MKLTAIPFNKIKSGQKVIESRLYDEKRQAIEPGDEIEFIQTEEPHNVIRTKVTGLLKYPTFKQLFTENDPKLFGGDTAENLLIEIKQFYSDEDEAKYGVLGIRLECF